MKKKFIMVSTILLVMLSCGNMETNPISIECVENTKSVDVVDSCLLRKIVTYVKCFEIESEEIIVVEFVNKWYEPSKKGIDTLAALSIKTKDNFFYGYDGGYKGCFKIKNNFVEIYDSLNIGTSFYCRELLLDTVLYATQEKDNIMPKGFLILMKDDDTLSFYDIPPCC
jgi:hypothetical protein